MSDLIDPGAAAPAPSPEPEPAGPVEYKSFTRTQLQPQSAVGPSIEHKEAAPRPEAPATPTEQTASSRMAQAARRERAAQEAEARLAQENRYRYVERQRQIARLPRQQQEQVIREDNRQAWQQHSREVDQHVRANGERWELVNRLEMQQQVTEVQYDYWQRTGRLITAAQAADAVEEKLTRQLEAAAGTKRFASLRDRSASRPAPVNWTERHDPFNSEERMRRARAALDTLSTRRKK
jgi:hypothetical protein